MERPAILVFHGITMSGASILRLLGPIAQKLEDAGFALIAPDAPNEMSEEAVESLLRWVSKQYAARGQVAQDAFSEEVFWAGPRCDWFAAETDPETKKKDYTGLLKSLERIREVTQNQRVVGILGFSQGCAMAGLATGLAKQGVLPFGDSLRFGVYLSGFKPAFDLPTFAASPWPVQDVKGWFAVGQEDALFPGTASIQGLAEAFEHAEVHHIEGLAHLVPTSPQWVEQIVQFAVKHGGE
ncbi:MAG: hypothetical protein H6728_01050 [Myxococcales bacterium]|nr:hypothetical protein [Myxococcales bacterium]